MLLQLENYMYIYASKHFVCAPHLNIVFCTSPPPSEKTTGALAHLDHYRN